MCSPGASTHSKSIHITAGMERSGLRPAETPHGRTMREKRPRTDWRRRDAWNRRLDTSSCKRRRCTDLRLLRRLCRKLAGAHTRRGGNEAGVRVRRRSSSGFSASACSDKRVAHGGVRFHASFRIPVQTLRDEINEKFIIAAKNLS